MKLKIAKLSILGMAAVAAGVALAASASTAEARWGRHHYWAGAATLGVVAGAAAAHGYAHPGLKYSEPEFRCWSEHRPIYNRFGEEVGTRRVRVCN